MSAGFKGIIGAEQLLATLENICNSVQDAAEETVKQAQKKFAALAKRDPPYDTGYLSESIKPQPVTRTGNTYIGIVETNEYGAYQEFGTGINGNAEVNPDFEGKLHFTLKKNGEDYQGIHPNPYFYPALVEMRDEFKDGAIELITDAIQSGGE